MFSTARTKKSPLAKICKQIAKPPTAVVPHISILKIDMQKRIRCTKAQFNNNKIIDRNLKESTALQKERNSNPILVS